MKVVLGVEMPRDMSKVKVKRATRRMVRPLPLKLKGFDSETLKTGYAFLLADSTGAHAWVRTLEDLLPFITSGETYVCYNMDFDAAAMLKWFGEGFCRTLLEVKTARFQGLRVWYVPRKFLYFIVGNKWTRFWDVNQYFAIQGRRVTLRVAAKRVKMEKLDFPVDDLNESYYGNEELLRYCINDAKITGSLGELVLNSLSRVGVHASSLASPATIVESYMIDQCGMVVPDMTEVPNEVLQYAENAVMPPWREFFKRGYFRRMYDYDISSAYPAVIRNLPDLSYGEWVYRKGAPPKVAALGYVQCVVDIPEAYVSWVNYRNRFGDNFTPCGRFPTTLTLGGLRYLVAANQLKRVIDGWYWVSRVRRPLFKRVIDSLYEEKRRAAKQSFERHLLKVLLASIYGKLHQVMDEGQAGRLYNPFYTAEVMTDTRLKVFELARQNPSALVGIHTDCVYSSEKLSVNQSDALGEWELRGVSSMLVVGLNHFEKGSGFLRYALGQEPDRVEYFERYGKGLRPLSLAEALRLNRFSETNVFLPFEERINVVKQVYKRRWLSIPKCGGDLLSNVYDSRPFPVVIADALNEGEALWELV